MTLSPCEQVECFLDDQFAGAGDALPADLELHLEGCETCRTHHDAELACEARIRETLASLASGAPPAEAVLRFLPARTPAPRAWLPFARAASLAIGAGVLSWLLVLGAFAPQGTETSRNPPGKQREDEVQKLRREVADLHAQLDDFKSKIEHLKAQGIDVERLAEVKVPRPLDGKVVAVNGDVLLAMINLGEKEGVEKGLVLTVYRGDRYIGQIVVDQVYPDMSSARIDPRFLTGQMKEGDDVTTRIR
ncbi:MAG: hypothetical protein HY720_13780 [Planctomycetes bacterium]|nr:hypothetical protein [Planctomycetota bacterium]